MHGDQRGRIAGDGIPRRARDQQECGEQGDAGGEGGAWRLQGAHPEDVGFHQSGTASSSIISPFSMVIVINIGRQQTWQSST
jgi:hypothetical protein